MGKHNWALGKHGEVLAEKYFLAAGMEIVARNYKIRGGEIDLIAKDGNTYVFIEVKTRKSAKFGTAAEAIHIKKQQALYKTAQRYIYENDLWNYKMRFDALLLTFDEMGRLSLKHIKNIEIAMG